MTGIADLVRRMAEAGAPPEAIAVAVEAIEQRDASDQEQAEARRAKDRIRKAASRERHAEVTVTSADSPRKKERSPTPPKEKTSPAREPKGSLAAPAGGARFDEFWKAYPKRKGANPRKPAEKKFATAVKNGADPDSIIAGAKAYAAEQHELDKVGTEFIAQAVVWLNQERWGDYSTSAQPSRDPEATRAHRKHQLEESLRHGTATALQRDQYRNEFGDPDTVEGPGDSDDEGQLCQRSDGSGSEIVAGGRRNGDVQGEAGLATVSAVDDVLRAATGTIQDKARGAFARRH